MTASNRKSTVFIVYVIAFHVFWMGPYVFWIYPRMRLLGEATLWYALVNVSLRLLVWVLPVFLYLRFVDRLNPIEYLKLRENWKRGVLIGLVLSVINLLGSVLRFGPPHLSLHSVTWNSVLSTSILIGFVEEIPYRGFMLQKFAEPFGFWIATLISSVLFLAMHLPGWISLHLFKTGQAISVFVFGLVMAIVFRYGKSLWGPIITHSTNDFIALVIFRL